MAHPDKIKPAYPSRRATIMGLPAFQGAEARKISDAFISSSLLLKYTCTLTTPKGMMVSAVIVTHLELEDWCLMKNFDLFTLDAPPDLALDNERSKIG